MIPRGAQQLFGPKNRAQPGNHGEKTKIDVVRQPGSLEIRTSVEWVCPNDCLSARRLSLFGIILGRDGRLNYELVSRR